jgi:lipoate-protein ligase B
LSPRDPRPQWLGRLRYDWAWRLQHLRRDAIIAGTAPEAFWLLEHDPVITTGKRPVPDLPSAEVLASRGIDLHKTERGGLATWHGPGQLVGYVILDIERHGLKVRTTVHGVEQGIIDWLASRGIEARRRSEYPGVWVGDDKICAIGLHFKRGVSMHGFGLNLSPSLDAYALFTPCGITDGGVTSVARVAGCAPDPWDVAEDVGNHVLAALARESD